MALLHVIVSSWLCLQVAHCLHLPYMSWPQTQPPHRYDQAAPEQIQDATIPRFLTFSTTNEENSENTSDWSNYLRSFYQSTGNNRPQDLPPENGGTWSYLNFLSRVQEPQKVDLQASSDRDAGTWSYLNFLNRVQQPQKVDLQASSNLDAASWYPWLQNKIDGLGAKETQGDVTSTYWYFWSKNNNDDNDEAVTQSETDAAWSWNLLAQQILNFEKINATDFSDFAAIWNYFSAGKEGLSTAVNKDSPNSTYAHLWNFLETLATTAQNKSGYSFSDWLTAANQWWSSNSTNATVKEEQPMGSWMDAYIQVASAYLQYKNDSQCSEKTFACPDLKDNFQAKVCCSKPWMADGSYLGFGAECWVDLQAMEDQCNMMECYKTEEGTWNTDGCSYSPDTLLNYEVCVLHDLCYVTRGVTQDQCDVAFKENMEKIYCDNVREDQRSLCSYKSATAKLATDVMSQFQTFYKGSDILRSKCIIKDNFLTRAWKFSQRKLGHNLRDLFE